MFEISISAWVRKDDMYLMQRRSLTDYFAPGKWITPGGKVELGETIIQALQRELMEEVGIAIDASEIQIIADYAFKKADIHKIVIIVLANWQSGEAAALEDAAEVKWFSKSELLALDLAFDTIKSEIALLK